MSPKVERKSQKIHFTQRTIAALPVPTGKRATYYDSQVAGLCIQLQPGSRHRAFAWYRKVAGRPTWRGIGDFPDLNVEQARTKAQEWNAQIGKWKADGCEGPSPLDRPRGEPTFGALLDDYIQRHLRQHAKRPEAAETNAKYLFKKYVDEWRERKLSMIRRSDVLDLQMRIAESVGQITSNRIMQLLRAMLNFAITAEVWSGDNPCSRVKLFHEEKRTRFVQPEEMPKLFRAMKKEPNRDLVDFVNLALWTGARRGDLLSARWEDIRTDDNCWRIPDPKNRTPYTVALTPEAVAIFKRRSRSNGSPWVFPSRGKTGHVVDLKGAWKRLIKRAGITDLRQHDLRRTLGSWQAAQGASLQIIGKSLGHTSTAATAIYSQLNLDPVRASVGGATRAMLAASKRKPKLLAVRNE
ncbi:MAG TPA: tyrosine-type recombinase/integrase [Candidatus Acidoferrales bacterium]|jgi:integrase|nr:tyrosine-type recombinase/integrase [Candidatus Acidoferrales bacterium]